MDLPARTSGPLVAASILAADFARMGEECADALAAGADLLHLDVMDGHFVDNLTMGPDMARALRRRFPDAFLDVHLMVTDPGKFLDPFADAGADLVSFHAETQPDAAATAALLERARGAGLRAGLAVSPATPVERIAEQGESLDLGLVMSVVPGRAGQSFLPATTGRLEALAPRLPAGVRLEVDGGIGPETAGTVVSAGAQILVTASALFGARDRSAVVRALRRSGP